MEHPDAKRSILVLYGSETGNAHDYAEELGRLCQRLRFESHVEELNAIELSALLQHRLVIFVMSTTGQGDLPQNSLLFWRKLLRKKLAPNCLEQMRYTCFGLGDSTYVKFNWAARKLVRRLEQLGATTFTDVFEADEQFPDGIDGSFVRWADDLRKLLLEEYPPPPGLEPIPDDSILPPRWSLEPALKSLQGKFINGIDFSKLSLEDQADQCMQADLPPTEILPIPDGWTATIAENRRLTPDSHWQDVRLIAFDIPDRETGDKLHCVPGDRLTVYPKNFAGDAQKLISLMGWDDIADQTLDLSSCGPLPRDLFAPRECTLRSLLLHNIDITAIPRRSFLKNMSYFSTDEYHRQRLLEFTMPEYLDEYYDYATRPRRSILEVLEEFTSVKIPADRLLDMFPLIRGRDFSIANGGASLKHPTRSDVTRVELVVALIRYRTVLRKPREGLCSRYLARLPAGSTVCVTRKPVLSAIHGLANSRRPLVAMATGTGIAPVRCLIQERLTHPSPGPTLIFFGNRNRAADFFFKDEWLALGQEFKGGNAHQSNHSTAEAPEPISAASSSSSSSLSSPLDSPEPSSPLESSWTSDSSSDPTSTSPSLLVFPAFSRDQREKVYVQDLVRQQAPKLANVIPDKAIFAVCGGSSKMADACRRAVFDPFTQAGEGDDSERKDMLSSITWWQEIW